MSEIERHVYAVWGVPPETQAYAMAKYSRSSQSMLESIAELSEERTAKFLETFYFAYGLFTVETYFMYERDLLDGPEEPVHLPLEVPLAANQNPPVTIRAVSSWVHTNDCMASPTPGERCSYPRGHWGCTHVGRHAGLRR